MSSGVKLEAPIKNKFEEFKMKKKIRVLSIVIEKDESTKKECFNIEKQIDKGSEADAAEKIQMLIEVLKDKRPRFVFFAMDVPNPNAKGQDKEELYLIQFIPDEAAIKEKMVYSSSASSIKDICSTSTKLLQVCDLDEVTPDLFLKK